MRLIVQTRLGDRKKIPPREQAFNTFQKGWIDRKRVGERPMRVAGFLDDDLAVALENVRHPRDFFRQSVSGWVFHRKENAHELVSSTHCGHNESVLRGQPSAGLDRCVLFKEVRAPR